jgi:hypothetical protein
MNLPVSNMTKLQTDIVQILANRTDSDGNLDPIILYDWVPENNPPDLYVIIDGYTVDERTHADKSAHMPGDGTHYMITLRAVARAPYRGFSAACDLLEEIECTIAKNLSGITVRGFTQLFVSSKTGEPISGPNDPIRSVTATFDFYLS